MKARVKATGEIVDVDFDKDALANDYPPYSTNETPSRFFLAEQLEWIDIEKKADPDYWTRLEHQYAGMAMQGLLNNPALAQLLRDDNITVKEKTRVISAWAKMYATAIVEKMKEK